MSALLIDNKPKYNEIVQKKKLYIQVLPCQTCQVALLIYSSTKFSWFQTLTTQYCFSSNVEFHSWKKKRPIGILCKPETYLCAENVGHWGQIIYCKLYTLCNYAVHNILCNYCGVYTESLHKMPHSCGYNIINVYIIWNKPNLSHYDYLYWPCQHFKGQFFCGYICNRSYVALSWNVEIK